MTWMTNFVTRGQHSGNMIDLEKNIRQTETGAIGSFLGNSLHSAFQPIFSLAHKRVVGYEALIRGFKENSVPAAPSSLFASACSDHALVFLDRLCRALHIVNFPRLNDENNWLFLNVSPDIIATGQSFGSFFNELLKATGMPAHRVVIEIVENSITLNTQLEETIKYYKDIGCLIAIDDFGAGHSNFERIWLLEPEIVKLDSSMICSAAEHAKIRHLLPGIVSLLHQAGSLVLVEGIESKEQAMIAMEADVDFVQGYYFAEPSTDYDAVKNTSPDFDILFRNYKSNNTGYGRQLLSIQKRFDSQIQSVVREIRRGRPLDEACQTLMADPSMIRCYFLKPDGIQIGHTVTSPFFRGNQDRKFSPLQDAESADWFRRHYLRNATRHPEQLQITQPYLSITGAHMCVTLSLMFETESKNRVFCCDLNWPANTI